MKGLPFHVRWDLWWYGMSARHHRWLCPLGFHLWVRTCWSRGKPVTDSPWYCVWCKREKAGA